MEEKLVELFLEDVNVVYQSVSLHLGSISNDIVADTLALHRSVDEDLQVDVSSTGKNFQNSHQVFNQLNDVEFQEHFRMKRSTMQKLIDHLRTKITDNQLNRMIVPFEKQVQVVVWILANKDSYRETGNLFGIHRSTVSHIFHTLCAKISESCGEFIKWPSIEEQSETKDYVFKAHKFPNCVGFIDGCHIQILAPANNPCDFHNRKEVHSVVLQAVCNEKLMFTNIYLGQTGRAHDARVFRESCLGDELQNLVSVENHILGDSAYTLSTRMMTPFRDNGYLSENQKKYNKVHSGARAYIERTFGRLKGKFRRLKYLELHDTKNITTIICAACVLHNFILLNEPDPIENSFEEIEANLELEGLTAVEKRAAICQFISTQ